MEGGADRIKQESPPASDPAPSSPPSKDENVPQEAPVTEAEPASASNSSQLELAYIMNHAVVFATNVDSWLSHSERFQVTKETFRSTPLSNWSSQGRVFHSRLVPKARVLWLFLSAAEEPTFLIFAVEIITLDPQPEDIQEAQIKALEAYNECLTEVGGGIKSGAITGVNIQSSRKPTLLNVISGLLSAEITTPEQREQINQVVFSFLQNEIPLSRLYAQFSHIVGYSTLRAVVKAISDSDDDPPSLPSSHKIVLKAKSQQQLPSPRTLETARSLSSGLPCPAYFFANELERLTFFSTDDERTPQFLQDVSLRYQYPFWVDPPVHESIPFRSGHHSIENGGVWLQIGGLLEEHSMSLFSTQPTAGLNGWEHLTVVNQFDMKSHTQPLQGSIPAEVYGASLVLAGDFTALDIHSECLIAFGGVNSLSLLEGAASMSLTDLQKKNAAAAVEFSDALAVLDLQSLKWTSIPCVGEIKPSPRAFHTSHIILQEIPNSKNECEMIGLFVMGGIGPNKDNQIVPLADAWFLSLATGKWRALPLGGQPEPHWAASLSVAGTNTFLLHGGASDSSVPGPQESLKLLTFDADKGRIRGKILPVPIAAVSEDEKPMSTKRSFHWSAVLKVQPTSIRQYELGMSLAPSNASLRNVLMLAGGQTETKNVTENIVLILLNVTNDGIVAATPIGKPVPQLRPFSAIEKNPIPRAFSSINFFFCFSPVPTTRPKPAVPALLYHGGVPIKATDGFDCKVPAQDLKSLSTWILSIPGVDPFELSWYSRDEQHSCRTKRRRDEMESQTAEEAEEEPLNDEGLFLQLLQKRKKYSAEISGQELARLFSEHLRHNAPWMAGLNFAPGIFQALGSVQIWPFTAVGNVLENSLVLGTRCTGLAVDVGISKSDGTFFFAVTDNGRGMNFTTVNKALKRFAHWDGPMERRDTMRSRPTLRYGMGLKFAFSRLGKGTVLMTRTRGTIGLSLLSQSLLFHAGAQCLSTPSCFWKLPSKDTTFPSLEHWRNQQKIQQFSPFKSAPALAEQINTLGHATGTRLVFYDCQPIYPLAIALDPLDGLLRLSASPNQSVYNGLSGSEILPTSSYKETTSDLIPLHTKIDRNELEHLEDGSSLPLGVPPAEDETSRKVKLSSYGSGSGALMLTPDETLSLMGDETAGSSLMKRLEAKALEITDVLPEFPCWSKARDSIDYCLPTYLYWTCLFSSASLFFSAYRLQPKEYPATSPQPDPFHNSLFRWLKQRLHGMVELDYLFSPDDAQAEGFGLLGFLNPLDSLIATEESVDTEPRVYEAGILLYYKERLIKRMFVPFPANAQLLDTYGRGKYPASHFKGSPVFMFPCTGIINVPEWLFPNASRDDFVANRSPIFDQFSYKMKKLVSEYLSVCLDEARRVEWITHRGREFLRDVGTSRPLSPMLHLALFKSAAREQDHHLDKIEEDKPPVPTLEDPPAPAAE